MAPFFIPAPFFIVRPAEASLMLPESFESLRAMRWSERDPVVDRSRSMLVRG
jgi:hypothetical protein